MANMCRKVLKNRRVVLQLSSCTNISNSDNGRRWLKNYEESDFTLFESHDVEKSGAGGLKEKEHRVRESILNLESGHAVKFGSLLVIMELVHIHECSLVMWGRICSPPPVSPTFPIGMIFTGVISYLLTILSGVCFRENGLEMMRQQQTFGF